tara:strand:+ start:217 stop:561 length:345 start_codon:yes stop_codon:yes gene_type:complete
MTEEQRVKLEELISEFEQVVLLAYEHGNKEYTRSEREKAYDRITNHLDMIQMKDGVTIREIAVWALTKHRDAVGDHLDLSDEELHNLFRRLCDHDPKRFEMVLEEFRFSRLSEE